MIAQSKLLFRDQEMTTAKIVPNPTPLLMTSTDVFPSFAKVEMLIKINSNVKIIFFM